MHTCWSVPRTGSKDLDNDTHKFLIANDRAKHECITLYAHQDMISRASRGGPHFLHEFGVIQGAAKAILVGRVYRV
jgi:hypothetical protein